LIATSRAHLDRRQREERERLEEKEAALRREAEQARILAEEQRRRADSSLALALAVQVQQGVGGRQQRLHLARQAHDLDRRSGGQAQSYVDAALRAVLNSSQFEAVLRGHTQAVWALAFSPDGSLLASGSDD